MIELRSLSADQTRELAAALASLVVPGDVVLLAGELGAGKTVFAQGFGSGLGVEDRITSPTFALHNRYEGRIRLEHIDVYRLGGLDEVVDLDLPGLIDDGGVVLVEWGDTITPALQADYLEIRLEVATEATEAAAGAVEDSLEVRALRLAPVGPRWSARSRALMEVLAPWAVQDRSEGTEPC